METRVTRALASYNLLSKSVPGVVLAVLGVLLLPSGLAFFPLDFGDTLADYAVTLLAGLLFGLFLGEGVHTAAIVTERVIVWAGRVIKVVFQALKTKILIYIQESRLKYVNNVIYAIFSGICYFVAAIVWSSSRPLLILSYPINSNIELFINKIFEIIVNGILKIGSWVGSGAQSWFKSRYNEFRDTLKSHRLLFAQSLITNYSKWITQ